MLPKQFDHKEFVDADSAPTLVAFDPNLGSLVSGRSAEDLANGIRPVVQGFKRFIGESEAYFEGRFAPSKTVPAQRRWEIRYDRTSKERTASTKEITRAFLSSLLGPANAISRQLIIGFPTVRDQDWSTQYRANISSVLKELGFDAFTFFPEPFAVFQYYRHVEELIPKARQPLSVLVVDMGGGTVDSCIIVTTNEGGLSRSGTTARPLGIQSIPRAGREVDRRLLIRAIKKLRDSRLKQESIADRIDSRPWILTSVEKAKISLAQRMQNMHLSDDCSHLREEVHLPGGSYHPDIHLDLSITGEDLKQVVKELWSERNGVGESILATVREARFRDGQVKLESLDKCILAGGSARLPFTREILAKTLSSALRLNTHDIVIGDHSDRAVAIGIAVEAAAQSEKSQLLHSSIGPCIFNDLYLFSALRRDEKAKKTQSQPRWRGAGRPPLRCCSLRTNSDV